MPTQDFKHTPEELSAFAETFGTFVISLKNGTVVEHEPKDLEAFRAWLAENNVRNINQQY